MKGFISILSLLFIFINHQPTLAQDTTLQGYEERVSVILEELRKNNEELYEIIKGISSIPKSSYWEAETSCMYLTTAYIEIIVTVYKYEYKLMLFSTFDKNTRYLYWFLWKKNKGINFALENIENILKKIRAIYGYISNKAALHLIDNAITNINNSSKLLNEVVEMLEKLDEKTFF